MQGPRDRTTSAYLQFPFFVFRLLNVAFQRLAYEACRSDRDNSDSLGAVSYTHLTLPTNREV